jgi:glycosyltransferase involved in cell wall biosynthesis
VTEADKSILIITPRLPYPLFSGGEHAQFHFIEALRTLMDVSICFEINSLDYNSNYNDFLKLKEIWKEVTFYPLINLDKPTTLVRSYRKIKQKVLELKKNIFDLVSRRKSESIDSVRYQSLINQTFLMCKPDLANNVDRILKNKHFDIIQIEFISLAPIVYILPTDSVKVLVHHELRHVRIKREVDLFEGIGPYDVCRLEAIKDQETSLLKRFDKIITLTENDMNVLSESIPSGKIYVSPATIKFDEKQNRVFSPFRNKLVFMGSSIHLPNKEGIQWFINSVMPIIEKEIPDIYLDIIGSWDNQFIKEYSRKNVNFIGFIEDLTSAVRSSLLIVPVRIGSGMRLKIIEAINNLVPFITTTIGVEGLDFENDRECIIADTPESFANGIVRLSKDASGQQEFVNHTAIKLKEKYSFESAIKKRLDFYKSLS